MDILERFIRALSSDEVRRFKILSNRFKRDDEKKMLILFDAIRNQEVYSKQEDIVLQLYENKDAKVMNRYYRLRNKLHSNLEKGLLFYHYDQKSPNQTQNYLLIARIFREKGLYEEVYHYLLKAEKAANANGLFYELELIYEEMVQLAARNVQVNITSVIEKRKENLKRIEVQRSTNEMLGIIAQKANRMNLRRGKKEGILEMLEQLKGQLEEYQELYDSPSGKIAVYRVVSAIFLRKGAYRELEAYIRDSFHQFQQEKLFNRNTHSLRLLMRVWWLNVHTSLLQLGEAENQLEALYKDLRMYENQNFNEFGIHYYRMKVMLDKLKGKPKEVAKSIKEATQHPGIMKNVLNEMYMLISLMDHYFTIEEYKKASDTFQKLHNHRQFSTLDEEFRFYTRIFEVVVSIESEKYQYAQDQIVSVRKAHKNLLKDEDYKKEAKFLQILLRICKSHTLGATVNLEEAYKQFVRNFPPAEIGGNQIIMYEHYLKSKLEERPYYNILREEVGRKVFA